MSSSGESVPLEPMSSRGSSVSSLMEKRCEEMLRLAALSQVSTEGEHDDLASIIERMKDELKTSVETGAYDREDEEEQTLVANDEAEKQDDLDTEASSIRFTNKNDNYFEKEASKQSFPHVGTPPRGSESLINEYSILCAKEYAPDTGRMENLLEKWMTDLKEHVLSEYRNSKARIVDIGRTQIKKSLEQFDTEREEVENSVENMKDLVNAYKKSNERQEKMISNLTDALNKQHEKMNALKKFYIWRSECNDRKREEFCSQIAFKFHNFCLMRQTWNAWHLQLENKWRDRVERACKARSEEVCVSVTNDYEARIAALNEKLTAAYTEIGRLKEEKEHSQDTMKKAFMRGVCALNMEAMSVLHNNPENEAILSAADEPIDVPRGSPGPRTCNTGPQCTITRHPASNAPHEVIINTDGVVRATAKPPRKAQMFSNKIVAKVDCGRRMENPHGNPPMGSIVIERHQPITKAPTGTAVTVKTILNHIRDQS